MRLLSIRTLHWSAMSSNTVEKAKHACSQLYRLLCIRVEERKERRKGRRKGKEVGEVCLGTFALWRVLAAVSEDVDLVDGSVRLKQLLQLLLRPGAWDLAHEHLDGVRVGLVRMLQRPVHLPGCAVAVEGEDKRGKRH